METGWPVVDVCRICFKKPLQNEFERVDLGKLSKFKNTYFILLENLDDYQAGIICNSCISNFKTVTTLYKYFLRSNNVVKKMKNQMKGNRIHLKDIFKNSQFLSPKKLQICRLCLKATNKVAIYLYDNATNIVPKEYIEMMLNYSRLPLVFLNETVHPILCFDCWQIIQVVYCFKKRLETVIEKVNHYKHLLQKKSLEKQDIEDIEYMWDKLVPIETVSSQEEVEVVESIENSSPHSNKKVCEHNRMPILIPQIIDCDKTPSKLPDSNCLISRKDSESMPILESQSSDSEVLKDENIELSKSLRNRIIITSNILVTKGVNKTVESQKSSNEKIKQKQSLVSGKTRSGNKKKKSIPNQKLSILLETIKQNNERLVKNVTPKHNLDQRVTRSESAKNELDTYFESDDLLILKKEVIIKEKRGKKRKHVFNSTPIEKRQTISNTSNINSLFSEDISPNKFKFEKLNFSKEVQQNKRNLPILKKLVDKDIGDDSDDVFIEEPSSNRLKNNQEKGKGDYPNLKCFIKIEPEDLFDVDDDELEPLPSDLDFQGSCNHSTQMHTVHEQTVYNFRGDLDKKLDIPKCEHSFKDESNTKKTQKTSNSSPDIMPSLTYFTSNIPNSCSRDVKEQAIFSATADSDKRSNVSNCKNSLEDVSKAKKAKKTSDSSQSVIPSLIYFSSKKPKAFSDDLRERAVFNTTNDLAKRCESKKSIADQLNQKRQRYKMLPIFKSVENKPAQNLNVSAKQVISQKGFPKLKSSERNDDPASLKIKVESFNIENWTKPGLHTKSTTAEDKNQVVDNISKVPEHTHSSYISKCTQPLVILLTPKNNLLSTPYKEQDISKPVSDLDKLESPAKNSSIETSKRKESDFGKQSKSTCDCVMCS